VFAIGGCADNAAVSGGRGRPTRRQLDLQVEIIDEFGMPDYLPVVKILIDGRELLAGPHGSARDRYYASPPAALLEDDVPLRPGPFPQRVVLYVCGCGEPGDRCIAPVIRESGNTVTWTDFRRCWDSGPDFDPPVLDLYPRASEPVAIPDLVFDREQYLGEVERVAAAREWESDQWRTALLLNEYLHPGHPWSIGEDLYPGRVQPGRDSADRFLVTLLDDCDRDGVVVGLTAGPGTPEERARSMADYLMATPTGQWPVIRRISNDG
jgi:hypothetical protein